MKRLPQEGLTINTYLLIIPPETFLHEQIMTVKTEFAQKYKIPAALKAKPHIMLASFRQIELIEPKMIRQLQCIGNRQKALKIELHNFGSFPSHTIYINVLTKSPIQNLVKNIRTATQKLFKLNKDVQAHYILESHIPIAKQLQPWQYEQAWLEYRHSFFSGTFVANKMVLLKRTATDTKWQYLQEFYFKNEQTILHQQPLF